MNYQFKIQNGKVYVYNFDNVKSERDMKPNIEEILVKENTIEQFNTNIESLKKSIKLSKTRKKFGYILATFGILLLPLIVSYFISGKIFLAIIELLIASYDIYIGYFENIRNRNRDIRITEKQIELLEQSVKEAEEELQILKEFNPNKKKSFILSNQDLELVPVDKKVFEQDRKMLIGHWYKLHRKQIVKAFKENLLEDIISMNTLPATLEDIDYIKELIKADLNIDNTKTKR